MPKKKFKKFKKSQQPQVKPEVIVNTITESGEVIMPAKKVVETKESKYQEDLAHLNEKYLPIRKDVFKLLMVITILIILFISVYVISQKTTILGSFGDWIYRVCNFQIQ